VGAEDSYTVDVRSSMQNAMADSEERFLNQLVQEYKEGHLGISHNTAYRLFMQYMNLLSLAGQEDLDEERAKTEEKADETKEPEAIKAVMKELMNKRSASQPLELPSAGSAFKRPVGGYAAALIDQAGLKGFQIGGAGISAKHADIAVNLGGATAADVLALLDHVSNVVYERSGIRLEPEIRIW